MNNYFVDTETVGFYGMPVLIQYAINDGETILYNVWEKPIQETLDLIDEIARNCIIGYNLGFDWYKLNQFYTTFIEASNKKLTPSDYSHEVIQGMEARGVHRGVIKPRSCLDLMMVALEDQYQDLLFKGTRTIYKVPKVLAESLIQELNKIEFPDLYFAKYVDPTQRWKIANVQGDFVDVQIVFRPSAKLKDLCKHIGITREGRDKFEDLNAPSPEKEFGFRPYGWATKNENKVVREHWYTNKKARQYARDDVEDTRGLYKHLGCPPADGVNSVLACMVASCKWKGFNVDTDMLEVLKADYLTKNSKETVNYDSSDQVYSYIGKVMTDLEKEIFKVDEKISCAKPILESIEKMKEIDICPECEAMSIDCPTCDGEGMVETKDHPAVARATHVLEGRKADKRIGLIDKFLVSKRFHASFNVMGTLSSRMSGGTGNDNKKDKSVNSQGIPSEDSFRSCFPLADTGEVLVGGDFDAFEVSIMCARYNDPNLIAELKKGKKIHGIFASFLFNLSYEEILKTKGTDNDLYGKGKTAVFALCYGGQPYTIAKQCGCTLEQAELGYKMWFEQFPNFRLVVEEITKDFSLINTDGESFKLVEGKPYVESMLGFKRHYRIEQKLIKSIWALIKDHPQWWDESEIECLRKQKKGTQKIGNALMSSLFGFMFSLQNSMIRTAMNHQIQSTGGQLTKELQVRLWELQPSGYSNWVVRELNIHDEVMAVCDNQVTADKTKVIVNDFIKEYQELIPLLGMNWANINGWCEKT